MATIGNDVFTLADWASRFGADNKAVPIIEMLTKRNDILADMLWMEGNLPDGHKHNIRTGLPTATWRLLNYGTPKTKSTTALVKDTPGILTARSEIDVDLANIGNNRNQVRAGEDAAHIQAMNNTVSETIFYGNQSLDPEKFTGLAPRYNSLSAESGENIVDAGGTGSDNTSIWLVNWDENGTFGFFNQGAKGGLDVMDDGEVDAYDAAGNLLRVYRTRFDWKCGLSVADWQRNVRIANIDVSLLADAGESGYTGALLELLMIEAANKQAMGVSGNTAWYCNREVMTALDKLAITKTNMALSYQEFGGKRVLMFRGIPIRRCDSILNTETRIT